MWLRCCSTVDAGASIEARSLHGWSALTIADAEGHDDLVGLLLDGERTRRCVLRMAMGPGIGWWSLERSARRLVRWIGVRSIGSMRRVRGLLTLYREHVPIAIDELVEGAWEALEATFDLTDLEGPRRDDHRDSVDFSLRQAFDRLAELGIVSMVDEARTANRYIGEDRSDGSVALAPLGVWAVQRMVSRIADAPVVGAFRNHPAAELLAAANHPAAELLAAASDLAEDVARAEIDAWVAHRDAATAASELCESLATADETARGLAFRALLRIGAPAADAVAALANVVDLAEFVTVFRVDTLLAAPGEMDRSRDPGGWVRLLHTVIELWGPDPAAAVWAASAAGDAGLDAMLDIAWRVKGEPTETVLAAIGDRHPDKRIAKTARKALFKHRSAR